MCELCQLNKPFKSNTHYLTDYIIRTALNQDGTNERGKGIYHAIDPNKAIVDFRFQQNASPERLEKILGRRTTDEENQDAKANIDFSVNDKFCVDCEKIFTTIEQKFHPLLKNFRDTDLTDTPEMFFNGVDASTIRMFFLLQVWRTCICDVSFAITDNMKERLRQKIFTQDYAGLEQFPLSITYMETKPLGKKEEESGDGYKTSNIVDSVEGANPNIIMMNDFYIQFYEDLNFPFDEFYGLNNELDYQDYINYQTEYLRVKIFSDTDRRLMLSNINRKFADGFMETQRTLFQMLYKHQFQTIPTHQIEEQYLNELKANSHVGNLSLEKLHEFINSFFERLD